MAPHAKKKEENWKSAFKAMKENYGLTDDAIGIFAINIRFNLDDFVTVATESLVGGGDDKKCDVLYIDKERQIAVVAQCYVSSKPRLAAPANKASDLNTAVSWLISTDLAELPEGLRSRADELRTSVVAGEVKQVYIWYVHNLPGSKNVENELRTVETTARIALSKLAPAQDVNIFAEEIFDNKLEKWYTQAERTIIVTDTFKTVISDAVEIDQPDWKSLLTVVKGSFMSDLYKRYKTDLFSANLRAYLGSRQSDSNINNGIKTSAEDEAGNFYVYNNGITAIVLDYKVGPRTSRGRNLEINGISIVNGAQTTGSLASISGKISDDLFVQVRFVKATKESIIANVVRFNNSQNKLQAADFRSNDSIQERLRTEFKLIPDAEYEGGRRGGASDAIKRSKFTLPSYTVGQSLAAFHGDPVTAYDKKSELWTNEKNYRQIFTDRTTARHVVFCYSLLSRINEQKLILTKKERKGKSSLTQIEQTSLSFLNKKGGNYLLVYIVAQCMETFIGKSIPNKFDLHFVSNISPTRASKHWASIVDMVLPLANQLDGAFSRGRITNEGMQKVVPNFVGVVASIATIHKQHLEQFSGYVKIG